MAQVDLADVAHEVVPLHQRPTILPTASDLNVTRHALDTTDSAEMSGRGPACDEIQAFISITQIVQAKLRWAIVIDWIVIICRSLGGTEGTDPRVGHTGFWTIMFSVVQGGHGPHVDWKTGRRTSTTRN